VHDFSENNIEKIPNADDMELFIKSPKHGQVRDNSAMINIDNIEFYEKQDIKMKEEVCPILSSDKVKFEISEEFNQSKILI